VEPEIQAVAPPPALDSAAWSTLADFLGRVFTNVTFTYGVSELLGVSVQVEQAMTDFLAVHLGRDEARIELLGSEVLSVLPHDKKLKLLDVVLRSNGWINDFPELVPTLQKLYDLRNQIAHSYGTPDEQPPGSDGVFTRRSYRRGRETVIRIDSADTIRLIDAVRDILATDILELTRRSLPPEIHIPRATAGSHS
jgi:hypothetical protein